MVTVISVVVTFWAFFCRKFKLQLTSRKGLFVEGLEVRSVGVGGETNRHALDVSHFFHGEVEGKA